MRVAYADPPYPGCAGIYRKHPDYAGEVDHRELIERLEREFPDGWALSTSAAALPFVLALCPEVQQASELRICAWARLPIPRPPARAMWSWEPLIVRTPHWRQRHKGDFVSDTLTFASQPSGYFGGTITGQKSAGFAYWMFALLGLGANDELVDLYPGSGAITKAWEAWRAQTRLAV
jgi:hypothetical protein